MTLTELANIYRTDKGTIKKESWEGPRHGYTEIYSKYFDSIRNKKLKVLEIGVGGGSPIICPSLKLWTNYFPSCEFFSMDIENKQTEITQQGLSSRVNFFQGDQKDRKALSVLKAFSPFDIIIDDGGHQMEQQQVSFGFLFSLLKKSGLYFIEDLHTSSFPIGTIIYGTQPIDIREDRQNTTLKMLEDYQVNKKIDSMYLTEEEIKYLNKHISNITIFDCCYPKSLCLVEKK